MKDRTSGHRNLKKGMIGIMVEEERWFDNESVVLEDYNKPWLGFNWAHLNSRSTASFIFAICEDTPKNRDDLLSRAWNYHVENNEPQRHFHVVERTPKKGVQPVQQKIGAHNKSTT